MSSHRLREKAKHKRAEAAALREAWGLQSEDLLPDEEHALLLDLLADCAGELQCTSPTLQRCGRCPRCALLARIDQL